MKKIISFIVPCYNSAAYMEKCLATLLVAAEDAEIIIINDGSKDKTLEIARKYEGLYPTIVRVVDQENGGHGEGVNQGLAHATGTYFKVVDSDDWANEAALKRILAQLKIFAQMDTPIDMLVANYVYENENFKKPKSMRYSNVFPTDRIFTWDEVGRFNASQYLLMHSVFYNTKTLQQSGVLLPKHTFYVDNIFVYVPLPFIKTMYYMNEDFYRYAIGREDQSVNEKVMITRVDQQILITKVMIESHNLNIIKAKNPKLAEYMFRYISMMMVVSTILLILNDTPESLQKQQELWDYVQKHDEKLYKRLKNRSLAALVNIPGKFGRKLSVAIYRFARSVFRFN